MNPKSPPRLAQDEGVGTAPPPPSWSPFSNQSLRDHHGGQDSTQDPFSDSICKSKKLAPFI